MPAKKKEKQKGPTSDFLQCSTCNHLISHTDAEAHTTSCPNSEGGFIHEKVLHGKVVSAEKLLGEDGTVITKGVKDFKNTVWMTISAMQLCGLSIGQPCVLNKLLVRQAWPVAKMPSLTAVAMTTSSMELLNISPGAVVTVERFQLPETTAKSAKLVIKESNQLFQSLQFSKYASAYLDQNYITEGTPLLINYFGQVCRCQVHSIVREDDTVKKCQLASLPSQFNLTSRMNEVTSCTSTPVKDQSFSLSSSLNTAVNSPSESFASKIDLNTSKESFCVENLSDSFSSLNFSNVSQNCASSPEVPFERHRFPNLMTPVKNSENFRPQYEPFVRVTGRALISVKAAEDLETEAADYHQPSVSLQDLGGLTAQIAELKSRITRGLQPSSNSRCILLYGPPGVGKTQLAKALTASLGLHSTYVAGTDVWSKLFGEAESNLKRLFETARERSPSVIVIDDIDVLCPKTAQSGQQAERIIGTLLSLVDSSSSDKSHPMVILGITNAKDNVDPALLRSGRFGCEVEVAVPTAQQRLQILQVMLTKVEHQLTDTDLLTVSRNAHGYVGADLAALINEASMHAYSRDYTTPPCLAMEDFAYAGLQVKPSALREIQLDIPEVRWSDIGGMAEVKMRLREAVELPLSQPKVYKRLGIEPPRGLLMYGPPGCSKTMVAKALATECHLNFLSVKGPELFNQYVGESEKAIREVFRKARSAAPSVIFFDEIDAIAAKRGGSSGVDDRVLTQLLTEMDGMESLKDVFVMAATNRPDKMDKALLRPGRFDSLVYVPLPDDSTRQEIFQAKFAKMSVACDVDVSALVRETHNYSGAEVVQVCQEAALFALREDLTASNVHNRHFHLALAKVQPQIDPDLLDLYAQFAKTKS